VALWLESWVGVVSVGGAACLRKLPQLQCAQGALPLPISKSISKSKSHPQQEQLTVTGNTRNKT
jgi:hypothetical protein